MKGILAYTEEELVSSDLRGNPHSSIFSAVDTVVLGPIRPCGTSLVCRPFIIDRYGGVRVRQGRISPRTASRGAAGLVKSGNKATANNNFALAA